MLSAGVSSLKFRSVQWLVVILVALLVLSACGGSSTPQPQPKAYLPPQPPLSGLPGAALQGVLQGLMPPDATLQLNIGLQMNRADLAQAAADIYDPSSPNYGHYLTPQQVADQFGASSANVQKVRQWLSDQGFQIMDVSPLHTNIIVKANVLQIAKAFQTILQIRSLDGRTFFGPNQAPVLPADIAPLISSITGLDNFTQLSHTPTVFGGNIYRAASQGANQPQAGDCTLYPITGFTRDQLARSYGIDQLNKKGYRGQGMKIGVLELSEPYSQNDVANYASCNGVSLHVKNVQVDGPLAAGPGEGEAALDLEMIVGLAPEAQIYDYQAPTLDTVGLIDSLNKVAADDIVQVLSISYGGGETGLDPAFMTQFDDTLELMAVEGISVFASSGDCGAFVDGVFGQLDVNFPASAPWAIAVGGTSFQGNGEIAWSDPNPDRSQCQNQWGTGGGVSRNSNFTRPVWQTGTNVQNKDSNGNRQVPDVAAAADSIAIYYRGGWLPVGGTSAAAPIWAAGTLLVDQILQKQGHTLFGGVPTVYQLANHPGKYHPFHDITKGNNQFYNAANGWDYPTGWGTPSFPDIAHVLGANF